MSATVEQGDLYRVALVVHFMANTYGLCRDVSVAQPRDPEPEPVVLPMPGQGVLL